MANPLSGQILLWTDGQGQVHYADRKSDTTTSSVVQLFPGDLSPPLNGWSQENIPSATSNREATAHTPATQVTNPAQQLSINLPTDGQVLWSGSGTVDVVLEGAVLKERESFALRLDGTLLPDRYRQSHIRLHNLDRGTHNLQALILDSFDKNIAKSQSLTFHLHRPSRLYTKAPK